MKNKDEGKLTYEIEITPAMVDAGKDALRAYDPNDDDINAVTSEEVVRAVFVAMVCAQRAP